MPEDGDANVESSDNLMQAIKIILIADLVMSLDNVVAVAAVAKGSMVLLVLGLAISIPLVIFGATILMKLMERYPIIVIIGAALIGSVAGELLVTDPILLDWVKANMPWLEIHLPIVGEISWAQIVGAVLVVVQQGVGNRFLLPCGAPGAAKNDAQRWAFAFFVKDPRDFKYLKVLLIAVDIKSNAFQQ